MKNRTLLAIFSIAVGVGLAPLKSRAASTFAFDSAPSGASSFNLTQDNITLTVSEIISNTGLSKTDQDGICIAGANFDYCQNISSLSLTFNKPVQLLSYVTGFNDFVAPLIISFSQLSSTSSQNSFPAQTITPFSNQFIAVPGVPIITSRTSTESRNASLVLYSLTVQSVPGPMPLAGAAIALSLSRKLRRRNSLR